MLLRSSELESKLDAIEQNANKNAAPNYARVITKTIKSAEDQPTVSVTTQLKEESSKTSNSSYINPSTLSTTKTTFASSENISFNSPNPSDISSIYKVVENLLKEVREMKSQQKVMSQQINTMHHQLIQQKIHYLLK